MQSRISTWNPPRADAAPNVRGPRTPQSEAAGVTAAHILSDQVERLDRHGACWAEMPELEAFLRSRFRFLPARLPATKEALESDIRLSEQVDLQMYGAMTGHIDLGLIQALLCEMSTPRVLTQPERRALQNATIRIENAVA